MSAQPRNPPEAAREFYREQLALAFRHSRPLYQPLGTVAELIVDTPAFETAVRESAPGSLDSARRIGEMVLVLLDGAPTLAKALPEAPGAWWRDLLQYERACFLQLATTIEGLPTNRPRRGVSALCMTFSWHVPKMVERLKLGGEITADLRKPVTLLFSRQPNGKPCVVEVGSAVEKVFRATNGLRTVEQIAATADVSLKETQRMLEALGGVGAVALALSPDELSRIISARDTPR